MRIDEKLKIANEIVDYLNRKQAAGYSPLKAQLYCSPKNWGATAMRRSEVKEIKVSDLMELSDSELLELQKKVLAAQKGKEVKTRNERYFLK